MDIHNDHFTFRRPENLFLSKIIEYYFFIDIPISQLTEEPEFMIPFPRITIGYFFEHPFMVVNDTLNKHQVINTAISRISTQKINVKPVTDRIKILGAHIRPFGLAYFTKKPINKLPWLINTEELFGTIAKEFIQKVHLLSNTEEMFNAMENVFLENILTRDLTLITKAIDLIELNCGHIEIAELSKQLEVSDRTLRNHFYEYIGCSPKEYFRVVKMKQITYQMRNSENSLTQIAHDNNYFDQAHFNHEFKDITGQSPKNIRKEIPNFRFLQF